MQEIEKHYIQILIIGLIIWLIGFTSFINPFMSPILTILFILCGSASVIYGTLLFLKKRMNTTPKNQVEIDPTKRTEAIEKTYKFMTSIYAIIAIILLIMNDIMAAALVGIGLIISTIILFINMRTK